ncbi:mechanosensitive ion channel family protein [Candidatus Peregrinibacteria bacterium]|nr:MAG: mechanosensitive ion channel family protein [Candidatus Peregrinibacteria bacterium]
MNVVPFLESIEPILESIEPTLSYTIFGNTIGAYSFALSVFILIWIAIILFRTVILKHLRIFAEKTEDKLDDEIITVVEGISSFFYFFLAFYLMMKSLSLGGSFHKALDGIFFFLIILEAVRFAHLFIDITFERSLKKDSEMAKNGMRLVATILLWVIGGLMILSNLGYDITALAASLGIGGIAVALAAQNILGDLFSSFSIYFDRPFQIDDFIIVGNDMGVVKKIGLKTTRIMTLRGEELVVSNQELTSTRVLNFKKMNRRRIVFTFGVEYGTPTKKLEHISEMIQNIIHDEKLTEYDRCHFSSFGESSLTFECVYYVDSPEYNVYMDIQESINLAILKAFEQEGISMAFPTRTLYMRTEEK